MNSLLVIFALVASISLSSGCLNVYNPVCGRSSSNNCRTFMNICSFKMFKQYDDDYAEFEQVDMKYCRRNLGTAGCLSKNNAEATTPVPHRCGDSCKDLVNDPLCACKRSDSTDCKVFKNQCEFTQQICNESEPSYVTSDGSRCIRSTLFRNM